MKPIKTNAVLGVTCGILLVAAGVLAFNLASPRQPAPPKLPSEGGSSAALPSSSNAFGRPSQINWSSLHSTNYRQFIANLRAFGCPEQTIRDIVILDIAKVFALKRAEARRQGKPYQFWRTDQPDDHEVEGQLAQLQREQHKLVRDLLGVELMTARAQYWEEENPVEDYDFLPADKRHRLAELLARFDGQIDEIYARADGQLQPGDEERVRALDEQRAKELEALLTPDERKQYDLRYSALAEIVRSEFGGIRPTEEEFRKLFDVYKKYEKDMSEGFAVNQSNRDQFRTPERTAAERAFQEEVRAMLGEERFAELQRSHDPAYDALVQMARRFNLPDELPNELYGLKLKAEQQKLEIDSNPQLTPEQRREALAAIARKTESALTSVLGPDGYRTYATATGDWLGGLSQPDPESNFTP